jgi:hypothetical protein
LSVEATECHQHHDDKVGHQTFEEVEVAQQGYLHSFARLFCFLALFRKILSNMPLAERFQKIDPCLGAIVVGAKI